VPGVCRLHSLDPQRGPILPTRFIEEGSRYTCVFLIETVIGLREPPQDEALAEFGERRRPGVARRRALAVGVLAVFAFAVTFAIGTATRTPRTTDSVPPAAPAPAPAVSRVDQATIGAVLAAPALPALRAAPSKQPAPARSGGSQTTTSSPALTAAAPPVSGGGPPVSGGGPPVSGGGGGGGGGGSGGGGGGLGGGGLLGGGGSSSGGG